MRRFTSAVAIVAGLASAAMAEPEVHVVGIYEGFDQSDGQIHGPKARVVLDRPGAEVVLVLSSYEALRWEVTLAGGTPMPKVVVSDVENGRDSAVTVNGQPIQEPERVTLPLAYRQEGIRFRQLVWQVPGLFNVTRMASFTGTYTAEETPFVVNAVVDDPRNAVDSLRGLVSTDGVPTALLPLITLDSLAVVPDVRMTERGFEFPSEDGTSRLVPLPLEMPAIGWSVGAVHDGETGTTYGVTKKRDGLIYAHDAARDSWRVVRVLEGVDALSLNLDAEGRRLIIPTRDGLEAGPIALVDLGDVATSPLRMVELRDELAGLTDLYDVGNRPPPPLLVIGVDGDHLLLMAVEDGALVQPGRSADETDPPWRAWLADLSTGRVQLVGYGNGG